jgi:hypothetical protein
MALWACQDCGTVYAVGLPACPHCGGTEYQEDGVAKITTGSGPSLHTDGGGEPETGPETLSGPETPESAADPVPVKEQIAAGVPPEETVTIADQKAGVPPPPIPPAPDAAPPA